MAVPARGSGEAAEVDEHRVGTMDEFLHGLDPHTVSAIELVDTVSAIGVCFAVDLVKALSQRRIVGDETALGAQSDECEELVGFEVGFLQGPVRR